MNTAGSGGRRSATGAGSGPGHPAASPAGATSGAAGAASAPGPSAGQEVSAAARDMKERATGQVREAVDNAKTQARQAADDQKARAAEQIHGVAGALRETARRLDAQDQAFVGEYVERAGDELERLSAALRDKDLDALVGATETFARRQPALFLGGAVAGGFLLGRFLKSSAERREHDEDWRARRSFEERSPGAGPSGNRRV